jgi:hypothetical protein
MFRLCLSLVAVSFSLGSSWALDRADRFDRAFNKAAKTAGVEHRAKPGRCDKTTCEFLIAPRGRLSVVHDGGQRTIDEVAAYFDADARGGHDAIEVSKVLFDVFGADQPRDVRAAARVQMIEGAISAKRDGEISLGRWQYVTRPNDGRDIRLYVRSSR